jgi:hypothetical protein
LLSEVQRYRAIDMKCQRCLERESRYRAVSDLMDIAVCATCAQEARRLGIRVQTADQVSCAVDSRQEHAVCETNS